MVVPGSIPKIIRSVFNNLPKLASLNRQEGWFVHIQYPALTKTKVRKIANLVLRLLIILATTWYLYDQLVEKRNIVDLFGQFMLSANSTSQLVMLILAILLMPFNLLLEAKKWHLLISPIEKVKLNQSFTAVLTGISVSMFLPNRVGDYLGRVFILQKGSHIKGVLVTIIGSLAQVITTAVIGCIAVLFYLPIFYGVESSLHAWLFIGFVFAILIMLTGILVLYFNVGLLNLVIATLFRKQKEQLMRYAEVFSYYSRLQLLRVLLLSVGRYFVFSFQFILLLWFFEIPLSYLTAFLLAAIMYLLITLIPTIALTELGVRGSVSVYLFGTWLTKFGGYSATTEINVFLASTAVWFINLAIPALLGVLFVYRLKFFRREQNGS